MSYETKLTNAKFDLEKLEKDYHAYCRTSPDYGWTKRREYEDARRKLKAKISRLESRVLAEQGPIIHRDMFGQPFLPGVQVVWSDSGRYAGFAHTWYVSYCTPKQVSLVRDLARVGKTGTSTCPEYLLVVDKLIAPAPSASPSIVYVVWSLEDTDNVDIFFNKKEAEALYQEYGEFGQWAEKEIK